MSRHVYLGQARADIQAGDQVMVEVFVADDGAFTEVNVAHRAEPQHVVAADPLPGGAVIAGYSMRQIAAIDRAVEQRIRTMEAHITAKQATRQEVDEAQQELALLNTIRNQKVWSDETE